MSRLPPGFGARPFAHRGLHGAAGPENSLAAFAAALEQGYAIELDVQSSADGEAMVFHDYDLDRATGEVGQVDARDAEALRAVALTGGGTIPDLAETLSLIDGRAPVLVEIKDQSGEFGAGVDALARRVCDVVRASPWPEICAVMSFNPHHVMAARDHAPEVMRGIVAYDFGHPDDSGVDADHRAALADLAFLDAAQTDFVSYGADGLTRPAVVEARSRGVPVYCWTIRSAEEGRSALRHCDQITFEGFVPALD